ncbi:MAG: hypothetical protein WBI18_00270, partial [Candidatus Saccharicenans sp.]
KLRTQMTISKQVALFPVIQLEKLTGLYQKLFPLHGYHVSAYDRARGRPEEKYWRRRTSEVSSPV